MDAIFVLVFTAVITLIVVLAVRQKRSGMSADIKSGGSDEHVYVVDQAGSKSYGGLDLSSESLARMIGQDPVLAEQLGLKPKNSG
ncbi:MAG: hypothetical protein HRU32_00950 [Rhodobacteraceae bacterium]|nr:hypothetical protein [Paracoccaceae bacterium]